MEELKDRNKLNLRDYIVVALLVIVTVAWMWLCITIVSKLVS